MGDCHVSLKPVNKGFKLYFQSNCYKKCYLIWLRMFEIIVVAVRQKEIHGQDALSFVTVTGKVKIMKYRHLY